VILWPIRPGPSGAIPPPQGKLASINQWAGDELAVIRDRHRETTEARVAVLLADCEAVSAYHGNNHLPIMWRHYRSHRPALFSPPQVALVLTPAARARRSPLRPGPLSLVFLSLEVAALAIAAIVVVVVIYDDEYIWLEGWP
jgi:hypothetical protein